jgi:hypothetical protein
VPADLALGLRRSTLFGGYAWTRQGKALEWIRATEAGVELELHPGPAVRPSRELPTAVLPCAELTLETETAAEFEIGVLLSRRNPVWETEWRGDERVPLSLTPEAAPIAELDTRPATGDAEPERAIVIGSRRGFRRILYVLEDAVMMGWVPVSALRRGTSPTEVELLNLWAPSPDWLPISPFGVDDPTRLRESESESSPPRPCAWNAPLSVEMAGVRRQVGTIASGIPLVLGSAHEGMREVTFEHPSVTSLPSAARFWVPERLLYPCAGQASSAR